MRAFRTRRRGVWSNNHFQFERSFQECLHCSRLNTILFASSFIFLFNSAGETCVSYCAIGRQPPRIHGRRVVKSMVQFSPGNTFLPSPLPWMYTTQSLGSAKHRSAVPHHDPLESRINDMSSCWIQRPTIRENWWKRIIGRRQSDRSFDRIVLPVQELTNVFSKWNGNE